MSKSVNDGRRKRFTTVTDETTRVSPELIGTPLATFPRRIIAMAIDIAIIFAFAIPFMVLIYAFIIHSENPQLYGIVRKIALSSDDSLKKELLTELRMETLKIIEQRNPDILPAEFADPLQSDDDETLNKAIEKYSWNMVLSFSANDPITRFNSYDKTAVIGLDAYTGHISLFANMGGLVVLYFTLLVWRRNGRTIGKKWMEIRIVRLDGKPMTFLDSFGRAGGYSASLATAGLGFLEALWHPNRQPIHDRIAATVVINQKAPAPKAEKRPA